MIVTIDERLQLLNPTQKLKRVHNYDLESNHFSVEIHFNENGGVFNHSRSFESAQRLQVFHQN